MNRLYALVALITIAYSGLTQAKGPKETFMVVNPTDISSVMTIVINTGTRKDGSAKSTCKIHAFSPKNVADANTFIQTAVDNYQRVKVNRNEIMPWVNNALGVAGFISRAQVTTKIHKDGTPKLNEDGTPKIVYKWGYKQR